VTNSKPAPDIFLAAAQAMKLLPAECVVVEDAPAGIAAARAAGASAAVVLLHRRGTGTAQKRFCDSCSPSWMDGIHMHQPLSCTLAPLPQVCVSWA
jgi:beta-phosphoglucomutase-like phosphatase (HAD superfamily)